MLMTAYVGSGNASEQERLQEATAESQRRSDPECFQRRELRTCFDRSGRGCSTIWTAARFKVKQKYSTAPGL